MIKIAIRRWEKNKDKILAEFKEKHPESYLDIVKTLIKHISKGRCDSFSPDHNRITEIDHGHYQGTLVYVIGAKGYQPHRYWYTKSGYGSCSSCDTLQSIKDCNNELPTDWQAKQYQTLALHLLQGLKEMGEYLEGERET